MRSSARTRIVFASLALSAGLIVAGWFDYSATRRDLLALLVDQASGLRQAVAAAARAGDAAAQQMQSTIANRLLDNARLLAELDRRRALTPDLLREIVVANHLFRVTVLAADGTREFTAGTGGGPPPGAGRGFGPGPGGGQGIGGGQGPGRGQGMGGGQGSGTGFGNVLAERLLHGEETEAVSEIHGSRWGRGWRLSAGVRRPGGGAIVLNVDAAEIAELQQQASIDHMLEDIAAGAPEVAYVILVEGENRVAHGPLADAALSTPEPAADTVAQSIASDLPGLSALETTVGDTPVLEFGGQVDPSLESSPYLRLGLKLDGLRSAERRSLTRLVILLVSALALALLTLAFVGLRQEHGVLRAEHARAQEALRRRDRLAAMGELASTVAHEVRNPLNAIGMSVQRLRREFLAETPDAAASDQDDRRELLDVLASETQRINRIVQQFLEYARPPRLAFRQVDLSELLRDAAVGVEGLAESRSVSIDTDLPSSLACAVDPDQLKAAVDNLLRNAVEASPAGARVRIGLAGTDGGCAFSISDHGPGIPPEDLPRIFDLYFTTKAEGTGVGLAVTHRIVEGHGGSVEVDSAPGRGTRMIVNLPRRQPEEASGE